MPIWPFKKRRRSGVNSETVAVGARPALSEKAHPGPQRPARAAKSPPPAPTPPIPIPRKSSKRGRRRTSQEERALAMASKETVPDKENIPLAQRKSSIEDITALPVSRQLEQSPHLRPVDMDRPHIPYNFRPHSASQTSVQKDEPIAFPTRPRTLRSRRSETPQRRVSSRRRKGDHVREEEIRAMSAQQPIPKRPGEGPLRRDSKKMRSLGMKDSTVSLPPQDSVHSVMSGIAEQRGWEIGILDVFNPRPAVRLSNTPQFVSTPGGVPSGSYTERSASKKEKEKMPVSRDSNKKRERIGDHADDLDASDIRMLMERDAIRKERLKVKHQEKLDRKLRGRQGRNRGDSDRERKRREAEEVRRAEEARERAEAENRAREVIAPPTDVHPAFRDQPSDDKPEAVGLGIGEVQDDAEEGTAEQRHHGDPFADTAAEEAATPGAEKLPSMPGAFSPVATPMEDPVVETAKAVRMSQTSTPPLSPVQSRRPESSISQLVDSRRPSDIPPPPPPIDDDSRRASDSKSDRRTGTWATFFRRGGTNLKKADEGRGTPSEFSFSNTSRESMRNQPLPPHLVDTQSQPPRRKSGTPTRTQSKFREELPEMPISPPDSRLPSPDVTTAAAVAAAARRAKRTQARASIPQEEEIPETEAQLPGRTDTPVSPTVRGHGMMSASMASIDSEGSWLASGSAKRHSTQSALSRSNIGSLSRRKPEFSESYEDLGADRDNDYFRRTTPSPDSKGALQPKRGAAASPSSLAGASPNEESELGEPLALHNVESVRRQPTLVHRDARLKSREGLITEFHTGTAGGGGSSQPASAGAETNSPVDFDPETPEPEMQSATSVEYGGRGGGHARQVSAGSARLLDLRRSADLTRDSSGGRPTSQPQDSRL